ncbi:hypothetical protein [Azospirillum palustre]
MSGKSARWRDGLSELIGAPAACSFPGFQGKPLGLLRG